MKLSSPFARIPVVAIAALLTSNAAVAHAGSFQLTASSSPSDGLCALSVTDAQSAVLMLDSAEPGDCHSDVAQSLVDARADVTSLSLSLEQLIAAPPEGFRSASLSGGASAHQALVVFPSFDGYLYQRWHVTGSARSIGGQARIDVTGASVTRSLFASNGVDQIDEYLDVVQPVGATADPASDLLVSWMVEAMLSCSLRSAEFAEFAPAVATASVCDGSANLSIVLAAIWATDDDGNRIPDFYAVADGNPISPAATAVPEPTSMMLLGTGALLLARKRLRRGAVPVRTSPLPERS